MSAEQVTAAGAVALSDLRRHNAKIAAHLEAKKAAEAARAAYERAILQRYAETHR